MKSETLYIVGNGFDLHHGIPSDYNAFGKYLKAVDAATYALVEEYFPVDDDAFWWDFEARLADFDAESLLDNMSHFMAPYSSDDWSDSGHHDFQYEVGEVVGAISETLRDRFTDWVRTLAIPTSDNPPCPLVNLDRDAVFLTFNYTSTLQTLYRVDPSRVLHIHGSAAEPTEKLVLGHDWTAGAGERFSDRADAARDDVRLLEAYDIADGYFRSTFKPTSDIIAANEAFFLGLAQVREIRVMGHSLSAVDALYLRRTIAAVDAARTRWTISYHSKPASAVEAFAPLGIDPRLVRYARLAEF